MKDSRVPAGWNPEDHVLSFRLPWPWERLSEQARMRALRNNDPRVPEEYRLTNQHRLYTAKGVPVKDWDDLKESSKRLFYYNNDSRVPDGWVPDKPRELPFSRLDKKQQYTYYMQCHPSVPEDFIPSYGETEIEKFTFIKMKLEKKLKRVNDKLRLLELDGASQ
jgi:hypothetical protein